MSQAKFMKRLRYTADDELILLREVAEQNPLEDIEKWQNIRQKVQELTGKNFSIRALKDHLFLMLDIWLRKENRKKPGLDEGYYCERDNLLMEINEMCNQTKLSGKVKRRKLISKEKQIVDLVKKAKDLCTIKLSPQHSLTLSEENFHLNDTEDGTYYLTQDLNVLSEEVTEEVEAPNVKEPTQNSECKNRPIRKDALEYLQNKHETHNMLRKKEMELEEKRLQLEERKLTIEERRLTLEERRQDATENYRKEKLEMEKEKFKQEVRDRNQTSKIIEQQQKLIDALLKRVL